MPVSHSMRNLESLDFHPKSFHEAKHMLTLWNKGFFVDLLEVQE